MMARKIKGDNKSKSKPIKRLLIDGQKTNLRLEDALWKELRAMAEERDLSVSELLNGIDIKRKRSNLTSAIRLLVSTYRRKRE